VVANGAFFHLSWLPIVLVGALALVAGAWFGLGVARAVPSPLTPPVLAVAALLAMVFVVTVADPVLSPEPAGRLVLLAPSLGPVRNPFVTVSAAANAGQSAWLLGLAATGFLLAGVATPRSRLCALLPAVAGAAIALPLLPPTVAGMYVEDRAATRPVCSGDVCLTRLHERHLARWAGPGHEALRLLARLPDAPTVVRELTGTVSAPRVPDTVLVDLDQVWLRRASGDELTRSLLAGAGTPSCFGRHSGGRPDLRETAARTVAAAWFLGELQPLPGSWRGWTDVRRLAAPAWAQLRALPPAEQQARILALRAAALSCRGDLLDVLGAAR
jgi:hypothetical protein